MLYHIYHNVSIYHIIFSSPQGGPLAAVTLRLVTQNRFTEGGKSLICVPQGSLQRTCLKGTAS